MAVVGAFCSISASVVAPDPSTVEVESISLIAHYTLPTAQGERTIAFLAFGPNRRLVWLRSSGHLDSAEWCPSCSRYVEGANRDGGLPMPDGFWESGRLPGAVRRLARAEAEREGFQALSLTAFADRAPAGESATAPVGRRWLRFSPLMGGATHRIRLRIPESLAGVASLDLFFETTQGPGR